MVSVKKEVPTEIKKINLEGWYTGLNDRDKLRLLRYVKDVNTTSQFSFFIDIIQRSIVDKNSAFAIVMCQHAFKMISMSDYEKFMINELLIQGCYEADMYDDAKIACETNKKLFPFVKNEIIKMNKGSIPDVLYFRNYYINIMVGVENNYDLGFEMLEEYNRMGILSNEDLKCRKNSLNALRLQKLFDGIYAYRPKNGKRSNN